MVDYLTRYSGLVPGDLDPAVSRHHVTNMKDAYLKLRYLVDAGARAAVPRAARGVLSYALLPPRAAPACLRDAASTCQRFPPRWRNRSFAPSSACAGCVLVGHGLSKDLQMINIVVPKRQIIDTVRAPPPCPVAAPLCARAAAAVKCSASLRISVSVADAVKLNHPCNLLSATAHQPSCGCAQVELFYVPGERKVSLRFLAYALLSIKIQATVHDSVEDARTALALYRRYEELQAAGTFQETLTRLYREGHRLGWIVPGDDGKAQ